MADEKYVNSIQVKSEIYNIQDKPLTDKWNALVTEESYSTNPTMSDRFVYTDREGLKSSLISNAFTLVTNAGLCTTAATTVDKIVEISSMTEAPIYGITMILVTFTNGHRASSMNIKLNNYPSKPVYALGSNESLQEGSIIENGTMMFIYGNGCWYAFTPLLKNYNGVKKFVWGD